VTVPHHRFHLSNNRSSCIFFKFSSFGCHSNCCETKLLAILCPSNETSNIESKLYFLIFPRLVRAVAPRIIIICWIWCIQEQTALNNEAVRSLHAQHVDLQQLSNYRLMQKLVWIKRRSVTHIHKWGTHTPKMTFQFFVSTLLSFDNNNRKFLRNFFNSIQLDAYDIKSWWGV
jgi:hypothetical protein